MRYRCAHVSRGNARRDRRTGPLLRGIPARGSDADGSGRLLGHGRRLSASWSGQHARADRRRRRRPPPHSNSVADVPGCRAARPDAGPHAPGRLPRDRLLGYRGAHGPAVRRTRAAAPGAEPRRPRRVARRPADGGRPGACPSPGGVDAADRPRGAARRDGGSGPAAPAGVRTAVLRGRGRRRVAEVPRCRPGHRGAGVRGRGTAAPARAAAVGHRCGGGPRRGRTAVAARRGVRPHAPGGGRRRVPCRAADPQRPGPHTGRRRG
ncbi:hypothetical protein GA0115235_119992 [Streptomyces sp. DpondAA-F4a]|nr:hypothetical protein GA0115235_119992 [Streptomyces sp. DpondAA-F4a]